MKSDTAADGLAAFHDYTQAFQTLDPRAVVPHFHEPALMITPQGVFSLPNGAAVEQAYVHVMADVRAQGYAKTDFPQLAAQRLGDDLVVVSGVGIWKKESGEELQRFGMTYTLRRAAGAWRIIVVTIHDPSTALRLPTQSAG